MHQHRPFTAPFSWGSVSVDIQSDGIPDAVRDILVTDAMHILSCQCFATTIGDRYRSKAVGGPQTVQAPIFAESQLSGKMISGMVTVKIDRDDVDVDQHLVLIELQRRFIKPFEARARSVLSSHPLRIDLLSMRFARSPGFTGLLEGFFSDTSVFDRDMPAFGHHLRETMSAR